MIFTVTLNPSIDYIIHVDGLINGTVNRPLKEEYRFGGKGINISYVLAELDLDSTALGFVAGFTGEAIAKGIRSEHIKTDFIRLDEGISRMNIKILSGDETEINGLAPQVDEAALDSFMKKLGQVQDGDTVIIAGNAPETMPDDIYERILSALCGKDVRVVLDASGHQLLNCLGFRPFLIKPNLDELAELFDSDLSMPEAVEFSAAQLQMMGAQNVLVSMGSEGAMLMAADGRCRRIGTVDGKAVSTIGAGDSMVAGFVAGYELKRNYDIALRLGCACGSATAFMPGLAKVDLIEKLFSMYMKL